MNEQVKERWDAFCLWYHALTLRERVIVAVGTALSIGVLWYVMAVEPALKDHKSKVAQQKSQKQEMDTLALKQAEIMGNLAKDPNAELRKKIERLEKLGVGLDRQVDELSASWVSPTQMADALRSVLAQRGSLKLVSLSSDVPKSLRETASSARSANNDGESQQDIYVHGMQLVVEGSFFDVLGYLDELEASPWNFHWNSLAYKVNEFPQASVTLKVQTYSADRGWIGG